MAKKEIKHIVKRAGHSESYDQRKLYASIYSACLAVREHVGSAELIADKVCQDFEAWLGNKAEVTSNDIHRVATKDLTAYNDDAAWIYKHHKNVS